MTRLVLFMFVLAGTSLSGLAVVFTLLIGSDDITSLSIAALAGFCAGIPAALMLALRFQD